MTASKILHGLTPAVRDRAASTIGALAEELRGHELKLGINVKLKTPKLFLQVEGRKRDVTITELTREVPHVPTAAAGARTGRGAPSLGRDPQHRDYPSPRRRPPHHLREASPRLAYRHRDPRVLRRTQRRHPRRPHPGRLLGRIAVPRLGHPADLAGLGPSSSRRPRPHPAPRTARRRLVRRHRHPRRHQALHERLAHRPPRQGLPSRPQSRRPPPA